MVVYTSLPAGQEQARTRWNTHVSGEAFDRKKSPYLTEQAQKFMVQQGQCVVAGLDGHDELSGLLVLGTPGFVQTPDEHTCLVRLDGHLATSPILLKLRQSLQNGQTARFGLFFICHPTRERLCVHGKAELFTKRSLFRKSIWVRLHVEQSFFHCSKYIKTHIAGLTSQALVVPSEQIVQLKQLNDSQLRQLSEPVCAFIAKQSLCFLCTIGHDGQPAINHRGGAAGFLVTLPPDTLASGGTILLPDYSGNGAFEAIGNIFETGQAALVIPNYAAQLAVCVSGRAYVLELADLLPEIAQKCVGAERVVALAVQRVEVQSGNWSTALAYERARAERMLHTLK
ncbi:MAG: pyridoxamine 5'-phosphate oxidase family protein [Ktedonobacteraceae bacterium]|nr:pyridoxamine 5'-phosphate oxidase family protein [Ktedonobacteraceae bacterium]